jgi:hypothetical protein
VGIAVMILEFIPGTIIKAMNIDIARGSKKLFKGIMMKVSLLGFLFVASFNGLLISI